jgi:hypothetical protein
VISVEVLDARGEEAVEHLDYEWAIGGIVVKEYNEMTEKEEPYNAPTLRVPGGVDYEGKVITVKVTGTAPYEGTVTSLSTEGIIKNTAPLGVFVKHSTKAPFVGETVEAVFYPKGTFDDNATYQWKRDGANIAGATGKTYAVTAKDKGGKLSVVAKVTSKVAGATEQFTLPESRETSAVKDTLTGAELKVKSTNSKLNTVFTTEDTAVPTLTIDGKAPTDEAFTYAWYIDSVADENQLFKDPFNPSRASGMIPGGMMTQTPAGNEDGSLTLAGIGRHNNGNFFLYKATEPTSIVGHKLIAVAKSTAGSLKQGEVRSNATTEVKIKVRGITEGNPVIVTDTFGYVEDQKVNRYIASKTTMSVAGLYPRDAEVTHQWYKKESETSAWEEISGATGLAYRIPAADSDGVYAYKVEIAGQGDYYGELTVETEDNIDVLAPTTGTYLAAVINGATEPRFSPVKFAQVGVELTASTDLAAADEWVDYYTWKWYDADGKLQTYKGDTFEMPEAGSDGVVKLEATMKEAASGEYLRPAPDIVIVQDAIASVELSSSADFAGSTQEEGYDKGITNPHVGETLTATAYDANDNEIGSDGLRFQWYRGDKKVKTAPYSARNEYLLTAKDIGETITCVVTGGSKVGYIGAVQISEATGAVTAMGTLGVYKNEEAPATAVRVGDTLYGWIDLMCIEAGEEVEVDPSIEAKFNRSENVEFLWTISEEGTAVKTSDKPMYRVTKADGPNETTEGAQVVKTIKCEASGFVLSEEGVDVWDTGLEIGPADYSH